MAFVPSLSLTSYTNTTFSGQQCAQLPRRGQAFACRRAFAPRMVAAKSTKVETKYELSDNALTLLSYLRGHKSVFLPGDGFIGATVALFKKNDTGRTFTPDDQLETNATLLSGREVASVMFRKADELIEEGVKVTLSKKKMSESEREVLVDVLKYNYDALFRAVSYGAACQAVDYLHPNNITMMKMLHDEIGISSKSVAAAINSVRDMVVDQVNDASVKKSTVECFDAARVALS